MRTQTDIHKVPAHIAAPRLLLLVVVLALLLFGFVMIYSTSSVIALLSATSPGDAQPMKDVFEQMGLAAFGIVLACIIGKCIPCSFWRGKVVWITWGVCMLLLLLTCFMGVGKGDWGAQRWLVIGGINLQPSEFAKIALVLMAARLFADLREDVCTRWVFAILIFLTILLPILIIFKAQSDLGTAIICAVGILAVMWLGGVPLKTILIVVACVVLFGCIGIFSSDYRRARLMVFLDPWNDGAGGHGTGYQIIHSFYALAGGGPFGVGLGNSHEKYSYLTQSDTDFIFAVIGEEFGLVGACAVIILFMLFLYAGLRIAREAVDNFSMMIAGGCTIMIVFQAFLNIAMVIGCAPPVGKPLPFISSGGSSLISTFIMVGFILSVSHASSAPSIYDRRRADLRVVRTTSLNEHQRHNDTAANSTADFSADRHFVSRQGRR